MRRWVALLLVACLGMMVPAGASSLRLCFDHASLTATGLGSIGQAGHGDDCCPGEPLTTPDGEPCCQQVEKLPAALLPSGGEIPPAMVVDLPPPVHPPVAVILSPSGAARHLPPIRGPAAALGSRALLEVWRL